MALLGSWECGGDDEVAHISQWDEGCVACTRRKKDSIEIIDLKTKGSSVTTMSKLVRGWLKPYLDESKLVELEHCWACYKLENGFVIVQCKYNIYVWDGVKLHTFPTVNSWVFLPDIICFEIHNPNGPDFLEIWNVNPLYQIMKVFGPVVSVSMLANHRIRMKQLNGYDGLIYPHHPATWQLIDLVQKTATIYHGNHFTMLESGYRVTCNKCNVWVQFIPFVGMARTVEKPVIECTPLRGPNRFLTKSDDNSVYLWDIDVYLAERELHPLWHSSHIVFHKLLGHFRHIQELSDGKFVCVGNNAMRILSSEGQCENQVEMGGSVHSILPLRNGQIATHNDMDLNIWDMYCWSKNQMEEFEHKINEYLDPVMKDVRPIVRLYLA